MKKIFLFLVLLCSACSKPAPQTCPPPIEIQQTNYQELNSDYQNLIDAAREVLKNSYNPYSNFYVGAALLTEDGKIITGTNFENAAYGSSICAERAAVLRANSMGYRRFRAMAIIAHGQDFDLAEPVAPCGACRQVIYEVSSLAEQPMELLLSNSQADTIFQTNINQLLPLAFGPRDLGLN